MFMKERMRQEKGRGYGVARRRERRDKYRGK